MADIQIKRAHREDKRLFCGQTQLGKQWMLRNMGKDEEEIWDRRFVMMISSDTVEDLVDQLKSEHIQVDID